jgi:hypothetical protein
VLKASPRFIGTDARQYAQKLVAAEADEEVIGAHVASEAFNHVLKQLVAGVMAVLVVDGLQAVHVHVRGHEAPAGSVRAVDLALEVLEPDAAPARAGELVSRGVLAVPLGFLAIGLPELAIRPSECAVTLRALAAARSALATFQPARAQLVYPQRSAVQDLFAVLELEHGLIGDVGVAVTPGG